jgi:ferritin-like metal-binding protein YciE
MRDTRRQQLFTGSNHLQIDEVNVMGLFSKDIETMDDLFVHLLRDIDYAEQRILQALPTMIEKATNPQLRSAFDHHRAETRSHLHRVERVFEKHGVERETVHCPAIDGIIQEADEVSGEADDDDKQVLDAALIAAADAALIAAAQAIEHYEISRYGTLIAWAKQLGHNDCASLLERNLEEERAADQTLTDIAKSRVNVTASLSA